MYLLFRYKVRFYITGGLISLGILFLVILIVDNAPKKTGAGQSILCVSEDAVRSFLHSFGWETGEEPPEVSDVLLPRTFSDSVLRYNELQRAQGYDLALYCGKQIKKYVFRIKNHPDASPGENIIATVLVYNGKIIGGDVASVRLDGFMHGFRYDEIQ